jgi:hypothetical protein
MDYSLAALKIFGSQLASATEAPSSEGASPAQMLFGIRFQRVWIQVPPNSLRLWPSLLPHLYQYPHFLGPSTDDLQR